MLRDVLAYFLAVGVGRVSSPTSRFSNASHLLPRFSSPGFGFHFGRRDHIAGIG